MFQDSCAKYFQENKERLHQRLVIDIKKYCKTKKRTT